MKNVINFKSIAVLSTAAILGLFILSGGRVARPVTGETFSYSITLNTANRATISAEYGNGSETFGNGNVLFNYVQVKDNLSYHTEMAAGGYIYNDSSTRITSMTRITAVFSGSLTLTTGNTANPTISPVVLASGVEEYVSGDPYFIKIAAGSTTYLTSLIIRYSCTPAATHLVPVFNYESNAATAGSHAVASPAEGYGFIVGTDGFASTVNASNVPAAAPSWTFENDGYDKNMAEFELEAKVRFDASTNNTSVFAMRISYAGYYDVQFSAKNNVSGWQGVQIYKNGGVLAAQHDNVSKGGLITDGSLTITPYTDYIFRVRSMIIDSTTALVSVFVNDIKVIEISGLLREALNANANHGMGASAGSWIKTDYFRGSRVVTA